MSSTPRWQANPGTSQKQRLPPALGAGYFRVDERSLPDFVETSAALARHLAFFDLRNHSDGHWGSWFDFDEAFVLARIAGIDVERLGAEFLRVVDDSATELRVLRVLALAHRIDDWYKALKVVDQPAGMAMCAQIRHLVERRLGGQLARTLERAPAGAAERFRKELSELWTGRAVLPHAAAANGEEFDPRSVFFSFLDAVAQMKERAAEQLAASLASDSHEPSAALLLAFLQLYGAVQQRINDFTLRHTDFYYRDCLRMAPRTAEHDSVHLVCRRAPAESLEVNVPRDAAFVLRNASGREIVYRADETLHVTPVQVAALHTLRLERDPLVSPEHELNYVTRATAERLPVSGEDALGKRGRLYWPLFGGSAREGHAQDADLGFAIASPLLFLAEGEREVRIRLRFEHPADLDATAAEEVSRFANEPRSASADDPRRLTELLEKLFARFLQLDPGPGTEASAEDRDALAKTMAHEAAPRIATKILGKHGGYDLRTLYSGFLVQRLLQARDESTFFTLLGRLFCRWMLLDPEALSDSDVEAIKKTLGRIPRRRPRKDRQGKRGRSPDSADILSLIRGEKLPKREFLIDKCSADLFGVSLTARDGWFSPADMFVTSGERSAASGAKDLTVVVRLPPEAPSIVAHDGKVHEGGLHTTLPAVRIRLKPGSTVFSYSLLADVVLSAIDMDVSVRGARDAVLHNNLGRLDPSKPFNPFGPMPARGSYLAFGSAEIARKNITGLRLNIEWGNLPEDDGGFRAHYRGYETDFHKQGFKVATAILCDGQWEPSPNAGREQALFAGTADDERLERTSGIEFDSAGLRNDFRPTRGAGAQEELRFDLATRSGFFRIVLTEPADTFGHREYPHLLTQVVSANAKRKEPLPLPNAPYTPLFERLTFDYEASGSMDLAQEIPVERSTSDDQVFLTHPFGFEEIYPAIRGTSKGPIPRFDQDGNLLIGLAAERTPGPVTLFFDLRDESARRLADRGQKPRISWFYLASNRWRPLPPACVVSDSTRGFLTSGIVALDIPADIDRANTILAADWFWLRVGADTGFEGFAGLYGVQAQAFRATRERTEAIVSDDDLPAAGTVAEPLVSIPGLLGVVQAGDAFDGRAPESQEQFKTRTGERLRHKNRAAVHWDYERLVLERFPDVFKVKCFSTTAAHAHAQGPADVTPAPRPGCVTLVVVPAPQMGVLEEIRAPKLNAVELDRIKDYIKERASPFAEIVVRNAAYERIQVRCAVRFKRGEQSGRRLQQLNREILERISPWHRGGAGAQFNWVLRKEEVEAWIRALDYVDWVTRVSLLQISEDDDSYFALGDSAREEIPQGTLRPLFPWSIAIPARQHAIELMTEATLAEAETTGIAGLEIGNTFIVGTQDG